MHADRIFLVGPMGAGKSTVGRRLAKTLGLDFIDSDRALEERTGVDIPLIFELEGEASFRRRESAMIDELTQRPGIVLATGGGAVLAADNRAWLRERGLVVYLQTSLERQMARTRHDKSRPLLQTPDPGAKLQELMAVRDPLYREVADIVVSTDRGGPRQVIKTIIQRIEQQSGGGGALLDKVEKT